ncbi:Uncharacterised protein [Mycobacteroides abscessus subsp. massiliense]|nr:Uncharacterised protein [Mycobacteroides abscessus subsp. massiliense]
MVDDLVDGTHVVHLLGGVGPAQEEDFARELLADHLGQVRAAVPAVETAHVGVGLLEARVLAARQSQVAHHMQAVSAAGGPAIHQGDHHLWHKADEALHFQDVQPARAPRIHRFGGLAPGVLISGAPPDALVAAGAECPAAVLGTGTVSGEQHRTHVGSHPCVIQGAVQLVHGVRAEGVAHLGAVERDPYGACLASPIGSVFDVPVIGDVGQVLEPRYRLPARRVKGIGGLPVVLGHGSDSRGHPLCGRSKPPGTTMPRLVPPRTSSTG